MRRLVVLLGLAAAVVSPGAAGRGALGVPGLPTHPSVAGGSKFIPAPGPAPTAAQCVRDWDRQTFRLTLRWIAARKPYGAFVNAGRIASQSSSRPGKIVSGPTCNVLVYFGHEQSVVATGVWKGGRVTAWFGDLEKNYPISSENALVSGDGRLHLFSTVPRQVPATIPGLPDPADPTDPRFMPAPGAAPTAAECAQAWNARLPRVTLHWIGGLNAYGALIYTIKHTYQSGTVSVTGPDCGYSVFFGHEQYLAIDGVWKDGDVTAWKGSLGTKMPLGSQNAGVAPDGSLYLR